MDKSDIIFENYYEDVLRFLRELSRDEYLAVMIRLFAVGGLPDSLLGSACTNLRQ